MEVYILDSLYRRTAVVDDHLSFIWTERMVTAGDFELVVSSTVPNRNRFAEGTYLGHKASKRVMQVQQIEDTINANGTKVLKLSGPSLEEILDDRVARGTLGDLTTTPKWSLTGTPKEIAEQMFHDICVSGVLDSADIITGIDEGSDLFPTDTIAPPADDVLYELDPTTLYSALNNLCVQFGLGFRIVKDPATSLLYFDVYSGCDRTSRQTDFDAVIFSPELDNLANIRRVNSTLGSKNVAYVFSPAGHQIVYPPDVDPSVAGFERHILPVTVTDIPSGDPDASDKMTAIGLLELAKHRPYAGFDGETPKNSQYEYGVHYNLGDLVEERDGTGNSNEMRVTEQIFVSDAEGDRSYPTLTLNKYITPGSWSSWPADETWSTVDPDLVWADASPD